MCLIAHRNPGSDASIPDQIIDYNCWLNGDGFGLAWREPSGIKTVRYGPFEKTKFVNKLNKLNKRDVELVAHFRMATHGPKTRNMAHPFSYVDPLVGRVYVFHNGIIDILTEKHESDTQVFVRDVLARMPSRWYDDPVLTWLVGEAIGWSRLLIMTPTETYKLGSGWKWQDGVHYSTEPEKVYPMGGTTYTTVYGSSSDDWKPSGKAISAMSDAEFRKWVDKQDDDDEEDKYLAAHSRPKEGMIVWHDAHRVKIVDVKDDEEQFAQYGYWGDAVCVNCGREGMYWEGGVGGKIDFDIEHIKGTVTHYPDKGQGAIAQVFDKIDEALAGGRKIS